MPVFTGKQETPAITGESISNFSHHDDCPPSFCSVYQSTFIIENRVSRVDPGNRSIKPQLQSIFTITQFFDTQPRADFLCAK